MCGWVLDRDTRTVLLKLAQADQPCGDLHFTCFDRWIELDHHAVCSTALPQDTTAELGASELFSLIVYPQFGIRLRPTRPPVQSQRRHAEI